MTISLNWAGILNIIQRSILKECSQQIKYRRCQGRKTCPQLSKWWNCADRQTLPLILRVETPLQLTQNLKQQGSKSISPIITYKVASKFVALVEKIWLNSNRLHLPNKTVCSDPTHGMFKVVSRPSAWTVSTKND